MHTEIEVKLLCEDGFAVGDLLARLGEVAEVIGPTAVRQTDTYYDTRSRSLARAGLSARCRRKGRSLPTIDLKVVPIISGLVMTRAELSSPLQRGQKPGPAVRRLAEASAPIRLRGIPVEQLLLRTNRQRFVVESDRCRAELTCDEVSVCRPGQRRGIPFSEIELELLDGALEGFDALVEVMKVQPQLEPSGKSKYLRALELLELPGYAYGAPRPAFDALLPADEAARAICRGQLETMLSYEPGTRVGLDSEQLHKMRVATRRLRSALTNFSCCFDKRGGEFLQRNFRWLAGVLGEVRDLDVHQLDLRRWRRELGARPERGWEELAGALEGRWSAARRRLIEALDSERYARLCERATAAFASTPRRRAAHPGQQPVGLLAAAMVRQRVKQLRRALKAYRRSSEPEAIHQLRIVGKKLRYTGEFFRPLYGSGFAARIKRLSSFQDELGLFQDSVVAGALAAELRDLALERGAVRGEYLHVLGLLGGSSAAGERLATLQVERALEQLGADKLLRSLVKDADRLAEQVAKALKKRAKEEEV